MTEKPEVTDAMASALSAAAGEPVRDTYYFLVRVGSDWDGYPFPWEPFRDLAGPMKAPQQALPLVMVSADGVLEKPSVHTSGDPFPHVVLTVSTATPLARIVDEWVSAVQAQGGAVQGSSDWFLPGLGLTPQEISTNTRSFLRLS